MENIMNSLMFGGWDADDSDFEFEGGWDDADDVDDTADCLYHLNCNTSSAVAIKLDELPF